MVDLHNPNVIGTLSGVDLGSSNKIEQGDTKVQVTDTGADGTIIMDADGTELFNATDTGQLLGVAGDTRLQLSQSGTLMYAYAGSEVALLLNPHEQKLGGVRAGGGEGDARATFEVDNTDVADISISMGTLNHYYICRDVTGGEGSAREHEWIIAGSTVAAFDGSNSYLGDPDDTYVLVGNISNEIEINNGNTLAVFGTADRCDFYFENAKVSETTANGITGAVWG